ncbi:MAG: hypothetical protein H6Q49_1779 [Deltaproteobacteria bacterium]|nr:hypothetical protein [Deltaproteobacteria bacterium]
MEILTANQRGGDAGKKKETRIILKPLISLCHSIELCTSIIVKQKNLTIKSLRKEQQQ